MSEKAKTLWVLIPLVIIFLVICVGFIMQPAMEAAAFNKFRSPDKPEATYWDAFWGDLKITSE